MLCEWEWDACKRMSINGSNYGAAPHVCWDWVGCSFLWLVRECLVTSVVYDGVMNSWYWAVVRRPICWYIVEMLVGGDDPVIMMSASCYTTSHSIGIWLITGLMIIYIHHLSPLIAGYTQRKEAWLALLYWRRRRWQSVLSSWVDGRLVSITPH